MIIEIVEFKDETIGIRKTTKEDNYAFARLRYAETFLSWTKMSALGGVRYTPSHRGRLDKMLDFLKKSEDIGEVI